MTWVDIFSNWEQQVYLQDLDYELVELCEMVPWSFWHQTPKPPNLLADHLAWLDRSYWISTVDQCQWLVLLVPWKLLISNSGKCILSFPILMMWFEYFISHVTQVCCGKYDISFCLVMNKWMHVVITFLENCYVSCLWPWIMARCCADYPSQS